MILTFFFMLIGNIYDEPSLPDPVCKEVEVNMDMKRNDAYCQIIHTDNNWSKAANINEVYLLLVWHMEHVNLQPLSKQNINHLVNNTLLITYPQNVIFYKLLH